jgi:hypothetical protein
MDEAGTTILHVFFIMRQIVGSQRIVEVTA